MFAADAPGVYATMALLNGINYPAVSSVGVRPTISDNAFTIETHVLDNGRFGPQPDLDLYGRQFRLAFVQWLREQSQFENLEQLAVAIGEDCARARALFDRIVV